MSDVEKSQARLRRMLVAALFVALAYVSRFVFHFHVAFLTFEFKDAIITIGGLYLGPLWALVMSAATALLEFLTISDTGVYGLIMNFVAAATFSLVASLIYRYRRTISGAMIGLSLGVVALVAVMLPMNLLITPYFMGASVSTVVAIIPTLLLPFNALKGIMNTSVVLLLYKPVTRALRAVHLNGTHTKEEGEERQSPLHGRFFWVVPAVGVVLLTASLLVFFLALHGNVYFGA